MQVGDWIAAVIDHIEDEEAIQRVRAQVREFAVQYPVPGIAAYNSRVHSGNGAALSRIFGQACVEWTVLYAAPHPAQARLD